MYTNYFLWLFNCDIAYFLYELDDLPIERKSNKWFSIQDGVSLNQLIYSIFPDWEDQNGSNQPIDEFPISMRWLK